MYSTLNLDHSLQMGFENSCGWLIALCFLFSPLEIKMFTLAILLLPFKQDVLEADNTSYSLQVTITWNGEGNGTPLQYSCLENPMDGGAWWAAVHRVAKSWTRLSDFPFTFHFHALEKEMAPHSSVLAWRIPRTGEPGGLPSMGSHRVGPDWSDLAAAAV